MEKYVEIKRWDNQEVIHSGYFISIKECLEDGVKRGISFYRADFTGVSLVAVNLTGSKLCGANLRNVYLWGCKGNNKEIKNIDIFEEYKVVYTKDILQIGCEGHLIEEWEVFSEEEILKMGGQEGLDFWHKNKYYIFNKIEEDPAL